MINRKKLEKQLIKELEKYPRKEPEIERINIKDIVIKLKEKKQGCY